MDSDDTNPNDQEPFGEGESDQRGDRESPRDFGIDPGIGVYAMFANFNYRPWTAIAEFVDNSISSYQRHRETLRSTSGHRYVLRVLITIDSTTNDVTIRDNAFGIEDDQYDRAFALAIPPPDLQYIGQFGVGMKAAACWFSNEWSVQSSALGEPVSKRVEWNTADIIAKQRRRLTPVDEEARQSDHYTVINLRDIRQPVRGQTLTKVKRYLASIYRGFLRTGEVEILVNGEVLVAPEPPVLLAPSWRDPSGSPVVWDRPLSIHLPNGRVVLGRAYVLATMDRNYASLNLFWHGRLIKGNFEPPFKPSEIFGAPNSFQSGRLYVELFLDGFKPTVDKQGFVYQETSEDELIELLRRELASPDFDLLGQATNYRSGKISREEIIGDILGSVISEGLTPGERLVTTPADPLPSSPYPAPDDTNRHSVADGEFRLNIEGRTWIIKLSVVNDNPDNPFVDIREVPPAKDEMPEVLEISLNYRHPFIRRWWNDENQGLLIQLAYAIGFGEVAARRAGAASPSFVRTNMDALLRRIAH